MVNVVADLGNSRLKWARLGSDGAVESAIVLPPDDENAWTSRWTEWGLVGSRSSWTISSVNPPVAERLADFLTRLGVRQVRWFRSAADVPVPHALQQPETAGADRALAVLAASSLYPDRGRPGVVILCGSAVVVERISPDGVWQGGAIAPGLNLSARGLHLLTAQLPLVTVTSTPPAWGDATVPAIAAGLFWGTVGAVREIVTRQSAGLTPSPWLLWTGGEAHLLAPWVGWEGARIVPDLVLHGLCRVVEAAEVEPRRR